MATLEPGSGLMVASGVMLTGDQLAAAMRMAGFHTQRSLAKASGVSQPTISRAMQARAEFPKIGADQMAAIIKVFEDAGVEFTLPAGASLAGELRMGVKKKAASE